MFAKRRRSVAVIGAVRPVIEGLESRRMLSASINAHGALNIHGTAHADSITVGVDPQNSAVCDVTVNGQTSTFTAAMISSVKINAAGGNDSVTVDSSLVAAASVLGSGGNDTLLAGSGSDSLNGGAGNDSLVSGTGADSLTGAAGNDTITCGDGADHVDGGIGHDSVQFTAAAGVALDTLPAAVQTGLTTLAQGATIGTVQPFVDNHQTYYGTEVTISGVDTRIVVDSSGNPVGDAPPARHGATAPQGPGQQGGPAQQDGVFGAVVSVDTAADTITIKASNPWGAAKTTTFTLTSATTITADSATTTLASLTADTLVCIQTSSTPATTATSITAIDQRVGGTVTAIDTTANTLTITGPGGTSNTYTVSASATVTLAGVASTLSAVTTGSQVQLTLAAIGGAVVSIQSDPQHIPGGNPAAPTGDAGGQVVSVDTTADTITLKNGVGVQTTFTLASAATITLDGTASTLSAIVAGDFVQLSLASDGTTVNSLEATDQVPPGNGGPDGGGNSGPGGGGDDTNPPTPAVFGAVVSVDATANTITLQAAGASTSTTYTLASGATVTLDDSTSTLSAIVAGDNALLQLGTGGTTVAVVHASDHSLPPPPAPPVNNPGAPAPTAGVADGNVASIDTTANTITLINPAGTSTTYTLTSTTAITLDGAASTLSAIVAGDMAHLTLATDGVTATAVQAGDTVPPTGNPTDPTNPTGPTNPTNPTNPIDPTNPTGPTNPTNPTNPVTPESVGGNIVSISTTANSVTLKDASGTSTTYTLSSSVTVTLDGATSTLSALAIGDHLQVTLAADGTTITAIAANDSATPPANPAPPPPGGQIVSIDATTDSVTLKDPTGKSTTYTLSSTVTVTLDGQPSTFSALKLGDGLQVTLAGDGTTVTSIAATDQPAPPPVVGK